MNHRIALVVGLIAAAALPARATEKLKVGQEFVYSGVLEYQEARTNQRAVTYQATVRLSALVTEADPAKGYTVLVMREIQPQQPPSPDDAAPFAELSVQRFRSDLNPAPGPERGPRPVLGAPLSSLLWNRPLPFYAAPAGRLADLHSGQSWETVEPIVFPGLQAPEVVFTVAGETKVNGRNCVRIEKKPKMLPVKNQAGNESISLTDYAGLLLVDRETGLTVRDAWRAGVLYEAGGLQTRVAGGAAIALKETREIPAAEVAARVRQAEALARVEDAAFAADPKADRKQQVDTAEQAIARYRRDYPSSPYAPALATLSAYLEPEARRLALLGEPAPPFRLTDLAGHEQPLAAYHGKLILLCFFASW